VEDYSGVKKLLCRSLLLSSKELLPLVLSFFGFANLDFSEYIVDATFQKTDARAYLYGQAHQGFFESLFPTFSRLGLRFSPHGVSPPHVVEANRVDHVCCNSYKSWGDEKDDSS
jgi:hypothetical protein